MKSMSEEGLDGGRLGGTAFSPSLFVAVAALLPLSTDSRARKPYCTLRPICSYMRLGMIQLAFYLVYV